MSSSSQRFAHASAPTHAAGSTPSPTDQKRRSFLLAFGAGTAGAAAAVAQPLVASVADPAVAADSATGYRETEHVRDYYATTRI